MKNTAGDEPVGALAVDPADTFERPIYAGNAIATEEDFDAAIRVSHEVENYSKRNDFGTS